MAQFGHDGSHGGEARGPVTPEVTPTPAATAGAGVARLEELLARGRPGPEEVVALIDAHRGEDPIDNLRIAIEIGRRLAEFGLTAHLLNSDGRGGMRPHSPPRATKCPSVDGISTSYRDGNN